MTQDDLWVLARKAGFHTGIAYGINGSELYKFAEPTAPNKNSMVELKRFAALVAAKAVAEEREACAQLAAQTVCDLHIPTGVKIYGSRAAKAIRARGCNV